MRQHVLNNHPFVRLFVPFALGVWSALSIGQLSSYWALALAISALTFLFVLLIPQFSFYRRFYSGILIFVSFYFLAFSFTAKKISQRELPVHIDEAFQQIGLVILNPLVEKANSYQTMGKIVAYSNSGFIGKKCLIYLPKEDNFSQLSPLDTLLTQQYLNPIPKPLNPYQFDYQKYMAKQQVFYQTFISKQQPVLIHNSTNQSFHFLEFLRTKSNDYFTTHLNFQNQALANAILLGNSSSLDSETKFQFQQAGTMHILAVSGLHVGIVYLLIHFLLTQLSRFFSIHKWLKLILTIALISLFVAVVGAKASSTRAGLMFSIFAIGQAISPRPYPVNSLAFAAIILLAINPNYLFDVSYQLSFSAVLGILILVPRLQELFPSSRFKLVNYFLDISYVSIAAQLATLPFVLYYFQQFPKFALLSNLVAIPLAFIIVSVGLLALVLSGVPIINSVLGLGLDYLLTSLNKLNELVSSIPKASFQSIYLTPIEFMLLALVVMSLIGFIKTNKSSLLFMGLLFFVGLLGSTTWSKMKTTNTEALTIYSVPKNVIVEYRKGRVANLFIKNPIEDRQYTLFLAANHKANYINQVNQFSIQDSISNGQFTFRNNCFVSPHFNWSITDAMDSLIYHTDVIIFDEPSYNQLQWIIKQPENQVSIVLANQYPNRLITDTVLNRHFLVNGFIEIQKKQAE